VRQFWGGQKKVENARNKDFGFRFDSNVGKLFLDNVGCGL
jgi:hypothetical protein